MTTSRTVRAVRANGRPSRSLRLANSPRGLFDDVEPINARRLLLAAMTAFAHRGYDATTTREIAALAGLSPAALYTHYPTKAAIFYEISLVGHNYILMLTREALEGTSDPREQVTRMVRASVTYHAEEVTLTRVVNAGFRGALQKHQQATIRKIRHEISGLVRGVLEEGVASRVFEVNNIHGATIALLRLVDVSSWYNPAGDMSPEELADVFVDLSLAMLRATDAP
jgi:AcrR family transcriptional regulator